MQKLAMILMAMVVLVLLGSGCATVRPSSGSHEVRRRMLVTGYCPCKDCCSWRRNWLGRPVYAAGPLKGKPKAVGVTASGTKARHGTIAADSRYPFGTVMYVAGYGYGRVEDRGGAIDGDHIDLFFSSHRDALQWGKRYRWVSVWFP